jgi:flagellar protein FliJ
VPPKTRLDVVVRLRERDEDRARRELADAQRQASAAEAAFREAALRAKHDARSRGTAADWELAESAHTRALWDARQAEHAVTAASEVVGTTRKTYIGAHSRAEALRRIVDTRRDEAVREADKAERKVLDDVATLMHGHARPSHRSR